ncbi:MAG: VOC family protein [Caldilineaceae bacterium]
MKLEHVAINVNEPAKLAQWLADNLDLRIVSAATTSPFAHFLADEDGSMIELYNNPIAPVPDYSEVNPYNLHFAFASDDIEADWQRLIDAGATAVGTVNPTPAGDKLAFLRTPWNEPIQLVQRKTPLV